MGEPYSLRYIVVKDSLGVSPPSYAVNYQPRKQAAEARFR
jgi:hypothetical protein